MKIIIILFILSLIISSTYAQEVDEKLAIKVAENYFDCKVPDSIKAIYRLATQNTCDAKLKVKKTILKIFNGKPSYYINNIEGGGWVLVSADKKTGPVIAYSEFGSYDPDNLSEVISDWMAQYDGIIEKRRLKDTVIVGKAEKWTKYEKEDLMLKSATNRPPFLIQSSWHQGDPYNRQVPDTMERNEGVNVDSGDRCPAGCPSITISQIVNYWGFSQGTAANFEFWNMPNSLHNATTKEIDATAYMISTIGKEHLDSDYCIDGFYRTGADNTENTFNALGYSIGELHKHNFYTGYNDWLGMLKTAIVTYKSPVDYRYKGDVWHEFICDGYDEDDGNLHFNLGYDENVETNRLWIDFEDLTTEKHNFLDENKQEFFRDIFPIVESSKVLTDIALNSGENHTWQVYFNLVAKSLTVNSGAKSQLVAGTAVTLLPGFWAKPGSELNAKAYLNDNLFYATLKSAHIGDNMSSSTYEPSNTAKLNDVKIFPNPAYGELTIETAILGEGVFQIFDLTGRLTLSGNLKSLSTNISLQNLMPGSYLLRIVFNSKTYQFKLVHH